MRFLILSQYYPPETGAAATRLEAMAGELLKRGHEVEVVCPMPNYPEGRIRSSYRWKLYTREESSGVSVRRFWLVAGQGKGWLRLACYLSFAFMACFGVCFVRRPDIIFVNSGPLFLTLPGYIASFIWRAPMILNVADLWPRSVVHLDAHVGRKGFLLKLAEKFEQWSYRKSRWITVVTEGIRDILLKEKSVDPEKILFLPNGVDAKVFHPLVSAGDLAQRLELQGKKVFLYAGSHGHMYALDKVLMAAKLLEPQSEIFILFIGGGAERTVLLEKARELALTNVMFLNPVPTRELADYISLAYCGLVHQKNSPLANENRPAKSFPLMAMGKAIAFAGFGEGAELVKSVGCGMVCPPEDPPALAELLMKLSRDPQNVARMGAAGRAWVEKNYTWSILTEAWLKNLDEKLTSSAK